MEIGRVWVAMEVPPKHRILTPRNAHMRTAFPYFARHAMHTEIRSSFCVVWVVRINRRYFSHPLPISSHHEVCIHPHQIILPWWSAYIVEPSGECVEPLTNDECEGWKSQSDVDVPDHVWEEEVVVLRRNSRPSSSSSIACPLACLPRDNSSHNFTSRRQWFFLNNGGKIDTSGSCEDQPTTYGRGRERDDDGVWSLSGF